MKKYKCLDCNDIIEEEDGFWERIEIDDKGGIYYVGYVCNQCHFDAVIRGEW